MAIFRTNHAVLREVNAAPETVEDKQKMAEMMDKWVKKADKVVLIDGCFLRCHGRIIEVLLELAYYF